MQDIIKTTERGWAGHYICANYFKFRRNTLLEYGDKKIIVSTVGNYTPPSYPDNFTQKEKKEMKKIGYERYYETMCFEAEWDGTYWDANVSKQIDFKSEWALNELEFDTDQKANDMHDKVVEEIKSRLLDNLQ